MRLGFRVCLCRSSVAVWGSSRLVRECRSSGTRTLCRLVRRPDLGRGRRGRRRQRRPDHGCRNQSSTVASQVTRHHDLSRSRASLSLSAGVAVAVAPGRTHALCVLLRSQGVHGWAVGWLGEAARPSRHRRCHRALSLCAHATRLGSVSGRDLSLGRGRCWRRACAGAASWQWMTIARILSSS